MVNSKQFLTVKFERDLFDKEYGMYKHAAKLSLFIGLSLYAAPGQELQLVLQTPVAKVVRWLSSGSPEANIAAGAVAASVVYSGACLVTLPYRAWSHASQKQQWAKELKEIARRVDKVENNPYQSSSNDQEDVKTQVTALVTLVENQKKEIALLQKQAERPGEASSCVTPMSSDFGKRLIAVEGTVTEHTGQIASATKKVNEAFHLGQKVEKLEETVTTLVSQVNQLQNKVFPQRKDNVGQDDQK